MTASCSNINGEFILKCLDVINIHFNLEYTFSSREDTSWALGTLINVDH